RAPRPRGRCRRLPPRALGVPCGLLRGLGPHAPRRRGRAALLAVRALQPHRALDQGAVSPLGRQLPPLLRGVQDRRLQGGAERHPRVDAMGGRPDLGRAALGARVRRIGADVGGTFTDVVLADADGRIRVEKVLSTPPDYDRAVVNAVRALGGADEVVHGTTVATNAVLEHRGARTALVTTAGFRDVLELRRMRMPHLYDAFWSKPPALVERSLRFEVGERMLADGTVERPLDEDEARAIAARLRDAAVESVAVCLLHAYLHPAHERRLGQILRAELSGVAVSLSSEILREQQEYERTATTVVNAYVRPLMASYLDSLRRGLGDADLSIMQSSGGVMSAAEAAARPVYVLESGHANAIAFDMGGTTAKASLIEHGRVSRTQEYEVGASLSVGSRLLRGSGELIRIPTID